MGLFFNMKEEVTKLNVFGKHPGYRKKPMSVPSNIEVAPNGARDWNDDSTKGEEPFGKQIGSSAPYDEKVINLLTDMVYDSIKGVLREDVDEKTFLRLPQQEQPAPMPEAPVGTTEMGAMDPMAGGMPPTMGDPSMGGDPNMGNPAGMEPMDPNAAPQDDQFGGNFDAGVEADEDTDPENYIQQLTGKLSQSLKDYDEQNPGKLDLDKYVIGMIVKQAVKGMDEGERKKVIKKIKETPLPSDDQMEDTSTEGVEPDPALDGQEPEAGQGETPNQEQPIQERSLKITKKQARRLMESIGDRGDSDDDRRDVKYSKYVKANKRTYPFIPPQFK